MSVFEAFCGDIHRLAERDIPFPDAAVGVEQVVDEMNRDELTAVLREMGSIPESIVASSSEEKLFSKASDIMLSRCFRLLGLESTVEKERADAADVTARSRHGYSLVADAKTFRLSRTAKNQKDFKIANLSKWRGDQHDFAVLVAPYFQYPKSHSQIYASALTDDVCLLSWEHLCFLVERGVSEREDFSLEAIWEFSKKRNRDSRMTGADRKDVPFEGISQALCKRVGADPAEFAAYMEQCRERIRRRTQREVTYLEREVDTLRSLSHEEAIRQLIRSSKLEEKIRTVKSCCKSLEPKE